MAEGKVILGILILVAVVGAVFLFYTFSKNPLNTAGVINNPDAIIEITSSGFTPGTLTISKGTTVTWTNKDTQEHWPASALHPTHTVYPGASYDEPGSYQGSQACKGEGEPKTGAFDACHGLAPGESFSFTFNEVGNWKYHDHIVNGLFGTIVVQ